MKLKVRFPHFLILLHLQLLVLATSGKPTIQPNACLGNRTHGEKDPWFKRKTEANNLKVFYVLFLIGMKKLPDHF